MKQFYYILAGKEVNLSGKKLNQLQFKLFFEIQILIL